MMFSIIAFIAIVCGMLAVFSGAAFAVSIMDRWVIGTGKTSKWKRFESPIWVSALLMAVSASMVLLYLLLIVLIFMDLVRSGILVDTRILLYPFLLTSVAVAMVGVVGWAYLVVRLNRELERSEQTCSLRYRRGAVIFVGLAVSGALFMFAYPPAILTLAKQSAMRMQASKSKSAMPSVVVDKELIQGSVE